MPWVTVKGINLKIVCPTADTKHTIKTLGKKLQLVLPEGEESFSKIRTIPATPGVEVLNLCIGGNQSQGYGALRDDGDQTVDSAQTKTS